MRRFAVALLLLSVGVTTTYTQDALTRDQRIDDLNALASFYAKNYAPYEWKKRHAGLRSAAAHAVAPADPPCGRPGVPGSDSSSTSRR